MTMVHNRSDFSMPRTGIHGGLRRGAAAAAVGAVLVLTTGVPASQAKEGAPGPGDPGAPAVDTQTLPVVAPLKGQSAVAQENAPGQDRGGKSSNGNAPADNGKGADAKQTASPSPAPTPSASAIPSALRPAAKATQKPAAPSPSATATASPVPTSSAPAASTPTASTPTATRAASSAPVGSAPAAGTPTATRTAPGAAPSAPGAVPEAPGTGTPAAPAPAAAGGTTPAQPAPPASTVAVDPATTAAGEPTAVAAAGETATATATGAVAGQGGYVPLYAVPRTQAGWSPYSSVPNGNSVRTSAVLAAQPEPKSALVWLGSGLVGMAGAAGLVFFRLRNP
ncbi:hypothetical protein [Arthrobacter sp. Alg241-R88]|uniref:hypothetical protein n=1 Tax=Arthrobacter sp. Alg241-R88 TaxID=2305984 RepID=UPI001967995E|nr:hypothetical protein [Arthrobacter sp. Alg241-R88]